VSILSKVTHIISGTVFSVNAAMADHIALPSYVFEAFTKIAIAYTGNENCSQIKLNNLAIEKFSQSTLGKVNKEYGISFPDIAVAMDEKNTEAAMVQYYEEFVERQTKNNPDIDICDAVLFEAQQDAKLARLIKVIQ
jgi:hypothetical protein